MLTWQLLCIIGIVFLILEIFTPSMFFLNFALAAFLTSGISFFVHEYFVLVIIFVVLSFCSFIFLRPIIVNNKNQNKTGIQDKYIDKTATVIEEVSEYNGVISIYDERWEARSDDKSVIKVGSKVKILRNESLIMFVENFEK